MCPAVLCRTLWCVLWVRQETPLAKAEYNLVTYLAYCFYVPLFLAGPDRGPLFFSHLGIADGMPIARVWACRYSK